MNKNTIHKIAGLGRMNSALLQVSKFALAAAILFGYQAASAETSSKLTEKNAVEIQQAKKKITGTIVDKAGAPFPGITVSIQGTNNATISDANGIYEIQAAPGEVIVFEMVGLKTVNQTVGASNTINVTMEEEAIGIDAAIVIGYGTTSERKITSSVSKVDAKQLSQLPVSNITQGLAGRASGLIVTQSGGGLGNTTNVSIRGGGTPLVVIDGIIRDYSDFVNLNSEDVAAMNILKDAAATAVYGARAGDGIIVITTKKGSGGKASISYSFNYMLTSFVKPIEKMSSYEIATSDNDIRKLYDLPARWRDDEIQKFKDGSDPAKYANTDWFNETLRDVAPEVRHNLSISGGDDKNSYYISLGIYEQQSLIKSGTNWLDRYNFRLQTDNLIESIGLRVKPAISGFLETTNSPKSVSTGFDYNNPIAGTYYYIFSHMQNLSPMNALYNKNGQILFDFDNPVIETSPESGYLRREVANFVGQLDLEWSNAAIPGLTLRASGNYTANFQNFKDWNKTAPVYDTEGNQGPTRSMSLAKYFNKSQSYTLQYIADYSRTFGKHYVSAMAGYEANYSWNQNLYGQRRNYIIPIDQMGVGPADTQTNSSGEGDAGRAGWVARVKYDYDNRYIIDGSMRYDGSDLFPEDKRWGMFFAGSVAWNLSQEKFWQVLKDKNIFNFFKIRASYGQTGVIPDNYGRFQYLSSYHYEGRGYVVDGKFVPTFREGALPSPDISWYTRNTLDIGFDFESLGGRLKGSFDYYYMVTSGYLHSPSSTSFTDPLGISLPQVLSNGEHRRGGVDFSLAWSDRVGELDYSVGGNLTFFDELVSRNWEESPEDIKNPYKRSTQRTGNYGIAYTNDGLYQSSADLMNSPRRDNSIGITAGDIKYQDVNGDGKIDGDDQTRMGTAGNKPRMNYGINASLGWKGINFFILFQGASDRDMYMGDKMRSTNAFIVYDYQRDYWTPTNTNAKYPRPVLNDGDNGNNNISSSNYWFINGAYLRLKTVQLGYDFKNRLLKNSKWLSKLELSFSAQNLFTISQASEFGMDPENSSMNNYAYPVTRTFSFNLNIGF